MRRNKVRSILLTLLVFLFLSSIVHAAMTIYLKDGSSRQVSKIVFKGNSADLFLSAGMVITVPASTIDLEGSGIPEAKGTYGGTAGTTGGTSAPKTLPPPADQESLKAQYAASTQTATAIHDHGMVHAGDTVRIVTQNDLSYTIVYKDTAGNYRKSMIEAGGFIENFKLNEAAKPAPPPLTTTSPAPEAAPPPVAEQPPVTENPHSSLLDDLSKKVTAPPLQSGSKSSILVPSLVAAGILVGAVVLAFVMMKQREKQFVSPPSELARRQNQAQSDLAEWQIEGKSKTDLIERSLRKIHLERPRAFSASMRMLKGDPKNLVVSGIARDTGQNAAQAELSYEKLKQVLDSVRRMVDETRPVPSAPLAATSSSAATAGVPERSFSPTATFHIVTRPTSITICSILLFLAGIALAALVLSGSAQTRALTGGGSSVGTWIGIVFTFACAYGYWTMKRWAVTLYAVNLALGVFLGMPMSQIAAPAVIVGFGIINFHEMSWK
jgi:hypothetical protein